MKLKAALSVLALVLVSVFMAAAPAQANHVGDCPDGTSCVYSSGSWNPHYVISYSGSGGVGHCNNITSTWNDVNVMELNGFGSGLRWRLWNDANCTGTNQIVCNGCLYTENIFSVYRKKMTSWMILNP